ncbi:g2259 [Coccomyxa viridis]|uniref:G2259 protein n=1 Tax=Coccomyxa viridis TaxID=1274662 RepID=A0ABP1FJY1_9CHLO
MAQVRSLAGAAVGSCHSSALRIKHSHKISSRGRSSTGTQALFGFGGGNKEEREWKKQEKEAAYQAQLDVLKRRKSGAWQKDVAERRGKVRRYETDPEFKKEVDADKRARAEAMRKADPPVTLFDIVIPIAPFGIPEYDLGERFDLKGPYCDSGYVDEDADFKKQFARFFGMGKKKQKPDQDDKPPKGKKR